MVTDGVVVSHATDATPTIGTLFEGKSFLVAQRVPQRNNFLARIRANGGRIVRLESQATYIIADHLRNDCPPTSISYTFIEAAIRAGAIPSTHAHRAGPAPGYIREIGSSAAPAKATRTAFTPQDDRDVWNWVQKCQLEGQAIKGYEIYKQLEAINTRHTFQSWRDRFLKKLMNNPPQGVTALLQRNTVAAVQAVIPPIPTVDGAADGQQPVNHMEDQEQEQEQEEEEEEDEDVRFLKDNMEDIMNVPTEDHDVMWDTLAEQEQCQHLTAGQWMRLYEDTVLPAYMAKQEREKRENASPLKRKPRLATPEPPFPESPQRDEPPTTPELVAMRLKLAKAREAAEAAEAAKAVEVAEAAKAAEERQASPSVNQKRKRQTPTPRSTTYGRKRARPDQADIFANDEPLDEWIPAPDFGLSEPANAQVILGHDEHTEIKNGEGNAQLALPAEEILQTSELNRAAKGQLIAEADQRDDDFALPAEQILSTEQEPEANETGFDMGGDKPNSIASLPAGNSHIDLDATPTQKEKIPSLADATELQEAGIISPSNFDSQAETGVMDEVLPQHGLQLTEENLASQQAEHGVKSMRAVDLREDGKDFEGYASYLQELLTDKQNEEIEKRALTAREEKSRNVAEGLSDLESDRELSPEQGLQAALDMPDATAGSDNGHDNANGGLVHDADLPAPSASQTGSDADMEEDDDIDLTLAEPEGGFDFSSQESVGLAQVTGQHQWEPQEEAQVHENHTNGETEMFSEDVEMEEGPARASVSRVEAALDTQAIYDAGTQQPDFSFPLPSQSDNDASEAELPANPLTKPSPARQPNPKPTVPSRTRTASATPKKAAIPASSRKQPTQQPQQPSSPEESESISSFLARLTAKGCTPASVQSALYRTSAQLQAAELVAMSEKLGLPVPEIPELWTERDDSMVDSTDAKVFKALCERKGWDEYDLRLKFLQEWRAGM